MEQSDEILSLLASRGDREAIQTIYRRYYPLMLNFGLKYYDNPALVRDCIQDLFVRLCLHPAILGGTRSLRSYLLVSLRNLMMDAIRDSHPGDVSLSDFTPRFTDIEEFRQFESEGVSDDEMRARQRLTRILNELSPNQKMILYLYYVRDLSHKDIADIMDIKPQSSMNLLSRTIIRIRKMMNLFILFYI